MPQFIDPSDALVHGHRDRRMHRFPDPPCDDCGSEEIAVTMRTTMTIYYRCYACGMIWALPKPDSRTHQPAPPGM